jgi:outer membrane receptor protein involved in Fe transport
MLRFNITGNLSRWLAAGSALALIGLSSSTLAQDDGDEVIEEITVTGSYIKGASTTGALPVTVLDRSELEALGAPTTTDVINDLVINSGSENRSNALGNQNRNTGTANINLRGLGLDKTLVLFNGKRQTIHSTSTGDGSSFVDINMLPGIAVERIEILKDGAAATYGSDAVAGVANFITRTEFEGLEISGSYRARSDSPSAARWDISGIWGWGNDDSNLVIAAAYSQLDQLVGNEVDWTTGQLDANRGVSSLAGPGALILTPDFTDAAQVGNLLAYLGSWGALQPAISSFVSSGYPMIDPGCEANGGIPFNVAGTTADLFSSAFGSEVIGGMINAVYGRCGYSFVEHYNLQDDQTKTNLWATYRYDINDDTEFYAELGYYANDVENIRNSPSFPVLRFEVIAAENPGNFMGIDGIYLGRPFGQNYPSMPSWRKYDNMRYLAGLRGNMGNGWDYDVSVNYSSSNVQESSPTVLQAEFGNALRGLGGPNCNPATGTPGVGDCMWFNPFSTRWSTVPNDPAVEQHMRSSNDLDQTASLLVFDAVFTHDLWDMANGTVEGAFGFQYRDEGLDAKRNPEATIPDNFIFVGGGQEFDESQDVYALFAELAVPLAEDVEAQLALRYEDYGSQIGDTIDPKVAVIWSATDNVALRASASTTFRAPSLHQRFNRETALLPLSDVPKGGGTPSTGYKGAEATGNPNLEPESATTYNIGLVLTPAEVFNLTLDYWNIDFEDVIVVEVPQIKVDIENATCVNRTADCRDPDILRNALTGEDPNDNLAHSGEISKVITRFVNAPSIEIDGMDLGATLTFDTDRGLFTLGLEASRIFHYDISGVPAFRNGSVTTVTLDAAGSRNEANFAPPVPQTRINTWLNYNRGKHGARMVARYISAYDDDKTPGRIYNYEIDSWMTVDLHYSYAFDDRTTFAFNITNVADRKPPFADQDLNFDARTHSPFGRMYQVVLRHNFGM